MRVAVGSEVGVGGMSVAVGEGGFVGVRVGTVWRSPRWFGAAQVLGPIASSSNPVRTMIKSNGK